jgi:16S rRNA (adenine1518-N6/adenine1519-N6)-dimethyltransferase
MKNSAKDSARAQASRSHGAGAVRPRKGLGQNFLVHPVHRARIVECARLARDDVVLEIGPGRGEMTELIAAQAGRVIAIELDDRLIPLLNAQFQGRNVEVIHGDILEIDVGRLMWNPTPCPITSSPTFHTHHGRAIRLLLESERPGIVGSHRTGRSRREDRRPPTEDEPATSVQYFARAQLVHRIPPGAFYPVPKVDSAVVRLDRITSRSDDDVSRDLFFRAVRAGYSQPRKKLRNSLAAGLRVSPQAATAILDASGVDPDRRAETLSIEQWTEVARHLGEPRDPTGSMAAPGPNGVR